MLNFRNLKTRLVVAYLLVFLMVLFSVAVIFYSVLKSTIEKSIDETLDLEINIITDSIETGLNASIRSYFKASAHNAYDLATSYQNRVIKNELTLEEAKDLYWEDIRQISIGDSGYFSIADQVSILRNPLEEMIGTETSVHDFAYHIYEYDEVFFDYEWKSPKESTYKTKSMYSIYFEPWNMYILATGYEDEFKHLVSIEELEEGILATKFGETGYVLVIDFEGNFVVHPEYKGINMMDRDDSMGQITRKAIREKNGKSEYMWKNPGEEDYRKKVTVYSELENYDMIIAATAYESEFLGPLEDLTKVFVMIVVLSIALVDRLHLVGQFS